jgi:hypothetical protein
MNYLLFFWCFLIVTVENSVKSPKRLSARGSESFSVVLNRKHIKNRVHNKVDIGLINPETVLTEKISEDRSSEKETKGLIRGLLRNSFVADVQTNTVFYHRSLTEYANDTASFLQDIKSIKKISLLTNPKNETRVISFALYGKKPKYNLGAIYNVEMAKVYFPGWKCRFYVTNDVLNLTISVLKDLGADIEYIPPGMGKMSGMFWRFVVADDPTVDRYLIRDVDSRMNARDR